MFCYREHVVYVSNIMHTNIINLEDMKRSFLYKEYKGCESIFLTSFLLFSWPIANSIYQHNLKILTVMVRKVCWSGVVWCDLSPSSSLCFISSLILLRSLHAYDLRSCHASSLIFCPVGATRTKDARELLYARQKVVVITKAFGLQAIDLVYIDYKDVEGLRLQAKEGALMGFTGKNSQICSCL